MKRGLSVLLAFLLIFTILPFFGSAAHAAGDGNIAIGTKDGIYHGTVTADATYHEEAGGYYTAPCGSTVTLSIRPYDGYRLKSLEIVYTSRQTTDETPITYDNQYRFVMPDEDKVFVYVTYSFEEGSVEPVAHSVTASYHDIDTGGKVTGNTVSVDKTQAFAGETVTVTVSMNEGTKFGTHGLLAYKSGDTNTSVSLTKVNDTTYTFVMPDYDVTVNGEFTFTNYDITVDAFDHSAVVSVYLSVNDHFYGTEPCTAQMGDTVKVQVNSKVDYGGVSAITYTYQKNGQIYSGTAQVTAGDSSLTYFGTFTMPASDTEIQVVLSKAYSVNLEGSQYMTIASSKTLAVAGETVTVTAVPNSGVRNAEWAVVYQNSEGKNVFVDTLTVDSSDPNKATFVMPAHEVTVYAFKGPVNYKKREWNSSRNAIDTTTAILYPYEYERVEEIKEMTGGWYVSDVDFTYNGRLTVSGDSYLVLRNESALTVSEGIYVKKGVTLTILGDRTDDGVLKCYGSDDDAGIGGNENAIGGSIVVWGGNITAEGGSNGAGIGGGNAKSGYQRISILGGSVNAKGGKYGAGIGTGEHNDNEEAGNITVYGGEVTATGGKQAAGIGGGDERESGLVTIWGGTVNAYGGKKAAGIGGGDDAHQGKPVNIHGGSVWAEGGEDGGAGIGSGESKYKLFGSTHYHGGEVNITGGTVYAKGGYDGGAGIGGGEGGDGGNIKISGGSVEAYGGDTSSGTDNGPGAGIGGGGYLDGGGKCGTVTISGGTVYAKGGSCSGNQENDGGGAPGIGSGIKTQSGTVIISGGDVTAVGGKWSMAIGSGYAGRGRGLVQIDGGKVTAIAGANYKELDLISSIPTPLGMSVNGNGDKFSMADNMCASDGKGNLITIADLNDAFFDRSIKTMIIQPCEHNGRKTYRIENENNHSVLCNHCNVGWRTEAHSYGESRYCECGYAPSGVATYTVYVTRTHWYSDGSWERNSSTESVAAGQKYYLPVPEELSIDIPRMFTGWKINEEQLKQPGEYVTVNTNLSITDEYKEACIVRFDAGGGKGTMEPVKVGKGENYNLPNCGFEKEGYVFSGWRKDNAGETLAYDTEITVNSDLKLTAVWKDPSKFFRFAGHSLSLSGDIKVNFYLYFPEAPADNPTVHFTWFNKSLDVTAVYDSASKLYMASCPLAVAEMTYDVTASITVGGETYTDVYSPVQYADTILDDDDFIDEYIVQEGEEKYVKLAELIKAMLDYGAKAQIQFDRNTDNLANKKLTDTDENSPYYYDPGEVTSDVIPVQSSDMREDLSQFGLEYYGTSLVYLSATTLRHYYKIKEADKFNGVSVSFGGISVEPTEYKDMIYFDKKNISAPDLDTVYQITFTKGDVSKSYVYSAMDYTRLVLASSNTSQKMKDLAAGTYHYNVKANEYISEGREAER